jgi:type IV pilus assembly protein PilO
MSVMTESPTRVQIQRSTDRIRGLFLPLNLYYGGVALLAILNLYLLIQIGFAWNTAHSHDENALAQQRVAMKTAEIAKKPLEGLDGKLMKATEQADGFYRKRLPYAYSQVASELGTLAKKQNVKLTRVQYGESPVLEGTNAALTEVRMDASLSGDYRPLVLFVNALERDRIFFVIKGVTLTGQQSGTVGLRLGLTTYLRAPEGTEGSDKGNTGAEEAPAKGSESQ